MKDRHTGRPRGFGFITYADPSVVDTVIAETHIINDKQVRNCFLKLFCLDGISMTVGVRWISFIFYIVKNKKLHWLIKLRINAVDVLCE